MAPVRLAHRDLPAWQHADDLAHLVYRLTWKFMQSDPGLAQRMRTAAIAVAVGIAGSQRGGGGQRRRMLAAASGALAELGYCAHFARRAGLIGDADVQRLTALEEEVHRHLEPLITSGQESNASPGENRARRI